MSEYRKVKSPQYIVFYCLFLSMICFVFGIVGFVLYGNNTIRVDGIGYYSYLPSIFINKNLEFSGFEYAIVSFPGNLTVNKYPIGVAICESPFFCVIYLFYKLLGINIRGDEITFQFMILVCGCFYYFMGTYFCAKTLRRFFAEKVVVFTLFFGTFGTRLAYYASVDVCLSHVYTYAIFSIVLFLALKCNKFYYDYFLMGLLSGLLIDIRNTNVIMVLIPCAMILKEILDKCYLSKELIIKSIYYIVGTLALLFPQLLYWYMSTGKWMVFSYQGEYFEFLSPHFWGTLFGIDEITGILRGAPILLVGCVVGYRFLNRYLSNYLITVISMCLLANFYLTASWWCWNSLSRRTYVDYMPAVFLLLASSFSFENKKMRMLVFICYSVCTVWSVYKMVQYLLCWVS